MDAGVGDLSAVPQLQGPEFRTATTDDRQPDVGQLDAVVEENLLDDRAHVRSSAGVASQQFQDRLDGKVGFEVVAAGKGDASPQVRLPGEEIEPPADPRARAQALGRKLREDPDDDVIRKVVENRETALPVWGQKTVVAAALVAGDQVLSVEGHLRR